MTTLRDYLMKRVLQVGASPFASEAANVRPEVSVAGGTRPRRKRRNAPAGDAHGTLAGLYRAVQERVTGASTHSLRKIYIEPTTRCNLHCRACMRRVWDECPGDMTRQTYDRLLAGMREMRTVRSVAYWGIGEPLMHPEIVRMVHSAHEIGLQTELITNAQLLDESLAAGLVDAGLDRIVVSLDGTTSAALAANRPGSKLATIYDNVASLRRIRDARGLRKPEIAVEFVLMRSNLGELGDLPRAAGELGVAVIYLTNVLPYSKELVSEILYPLAAASEAFAIHFEPSAAFVLPRLDARPEVVEAIRALPLRSSRGFAHPLILPSNYGSKCPFLERGALAVRRDGAVSPCVELLHSHTVYVLGREKKIRSCVFGHIGRQTLGEIWQRQEYREFRERLQRFEFSPCVGCGGCDMAENNEEDCIGNTFPTCGDCLWARGVILCP